MGLTVLSSEVFPENKIYKESQETYATLVINAKTVNGLNKKELTPFTYKDLGSMATIGRNLAVVDLPFWKFQGFFAWLLWGFVHIMSLAGFANKTSVFLTWAINYFTKNSDNRLIIRSFNRKTRTLEPEK